MYSTCPEARALPILCLQWRGATEALWHVSTFIRFIIYIYCISIIYKSGVNICSQILISIQQLQLLATDASAARPFPGLGAVIPAPSPGSQWSHQNHQMVIVIAIFNSYVKLPEGKAAMKFIEIPYLPAVLMWKPTFHRFNSFIPGGADRVDRVNGYCITRVNDGNNLRKLGYKPNVLWWNIT